MSLTDILNAREARWNQKRGLAMAENRPVVSLTLRMPQELRLCENAGKALSKASEEVFDILNGSFENVTFRGEFSSADGPYALFTAFGNAEEIKRMLVQFEENGALGELIDADVMTEAGEEISRISIGGRERTCLVCGKNAARICAKSDMHTREETVSVIRGILKTKLD